MDLKLTNQVAIVLASSKGLGKAIATTLAQERAIVIIASRNEEELSKVAEEIRQLSNAQVNYVKADVSKADDAERLIKQVGEQYGKIDILVNNAGGPPFAAFENLMMSNGKTRSNLTY
jgi:3-oxoacyl-[acyl-carrier protein] reductase